MKAAAKTLKAYRGSEIILDSFGLQVAFFRVHIDLGVGVRCVRGAIARGELNYG